MITCFRHYDILAETRTQSSLMKSGKCAQGFPFFFLPSLDATRTPLNLPTNHRANKRSGWVRVWFWLNFYHFRPFLFTFVIFAYRTRRSPYLVNRPSGMFSVLLIRFDSNTAHQYLPCQQDYLKEGMLMKLCRKDMQERMFFLVCIIPFSFLGSECRVFLMWDNFAARIFKAERLILAASSDYHDRK